MNKQKLIPVVGLVTMLLAGLSAPGLAQAHDGRDARAPVITVHVVEDKYIRWHQDHARAYAPRFSHEHQWYGHHEARPAYQASLVRRLIRDINRHDRWSDLTPRERKILKRELRRDQADRLAHRHEDTRIALRRDYDERS